MRSISTSIFVLSVCGASIATTVSASPTVGPSIKRPAIGGAAVPKPTLVGKVFTTPVPVAHGAPKVGAPFVKIPGSVSLTGIEVADRETFQNAAYWYGSIIALKGQHLGAEAKGRTVAFEPTDTLPNGKTRVPMRVASWADDTVRAFTPTSDDLGTQRPEGPGAGARGRIVIVDPQGLVLGGIADVSIGGIWFDRDGDGHRSQRAGGDDCDDFDRNRFPGNPETPDFEGHDEDCDANTIGNLDADGDGYIDTRVSNPGGKHGNDCDDSRGDVHPFQVDVCNGRDDNCDGRVDEELFNCPTTPH